MRSASTQAAIGLGVGVLSFAALGTITALWPNPVFVRMTPAGAWEIALLGAQSGLLGFYFAIRRPRCAVRIAGVGGVFNFLGIACPVCNKILLLLFGWDALMSYYEPIRIYVAALGVVVTALGVAFEWRRRRPGLLGPGIVSPVG